MDKSPHASASDYAVEFLRMCLAGQNKRPGSLSTQRVLFVGFLLKLFILAFNANAYAQIAAGKADRDQLHGGIITGRESAPAVVKAAGQSALKLYADKIKSSTALRRKLLVSSSVFLLLLLTLAFFVVRMLRQLRRGKEPKQRLEPSKRDIITVSIGRFTFFFGNSGEEDPTTIQNSAGPVRMYAE